MFHTEDLALRSRAERGLMRRDMRYCKFSALALFFPMMGASISNTYAETVQGRCLLQVDGKIYIKGACEIDLAEGGGFTISSPKDKYMFARVFPPEKDVAEGNWLGTGHGGLAERFDTLHRHGACWTNETTKVCARR